MKSSHMKRLVAPKTWPMVRKTTKFVTRPKANGQKKEFTMPVVMVLRDVLGMVQTAKQTRTILRTQTVTVNGTRVFDNDSAVGFMDVLTVEGRSYRVLINTNNVLTVVPVKKDENFIIQKIVGKTSLGKDKTQLNFSSGRNILVAKGDYKVGDSVSLNDGKMAKHFPLAKGACVMLVGGAHIGKVGNVDKIEGKMIFVKVGEEMVQTAKTHAFVVGAAKPELTLNE